MSQDNRLKAFISQYKNLALNRGLTSGNPIVVDIQKPHTAQSYKIALAYEEPSVNVLPINSSWLMLEPTNPFNMRVFKLKAYTDPETTTQDFYGSSLSPIKPSIVHVQLRQCWVEVTNYVDLFSEPMYYLNVNTPVAGAKGDKGDVGATGVKGDKGDVGIGLPAGGAQWEIPYKQSGADFDYTLGLLSLNSIANIASNTVIGSVSVDGIVTAIDMPTLRRMLGINDRFIDYYTDPAQLPTTNTTDFPPPSDLDSLIIARGLVDSNNAPNYRGIWAIVVQPSGTPIDPNTANSSIYVYDVASAIWVQSISDDDSGFELTDNKENVYPVSSSTFNYPASRAVLNTIQLPIFKCYREQFLDVSFAINPDGSWDLNMMTALPAFPTPDNLTLDYANNFVIKTNSVALVGGTTSLNLTGCRIDVDPTAGVMTAVTLYILDAAGMSITFPTNWKIMNKVFNGTINDNYFAFMLTTLDNGASFIVHWTQGV